MPSALTPLLLALPCLFLGFAYIKDNHHHVLCPVRAEAGGGGGGGGGGRGGGGVSEDGKNSETN